MPYDLVERLQGSGRVVHALGKGSEAEAVDQPHLLDHLLEPPTHVLALRELATNHQTELDVAHRSPPRKNVRLSGTRDRRESQIVISAKLAPGNLAGAAPPARMRGPGRRTIPGSRFRGRDDVIRHISREIQQHHALARSDGELPRTRPRQRGDVLAGLDLEKRLQRRRPDTYSAVAPA